MTTTEIAIGLKWSIIYEANFTADHITEEFDPPGADADDSPWKLSSDSGDCEDGQFTRNLIPYKAPEGTPAVSTPGKRRKWSGILDQAAFDAFVDEMNLSAEGTGKMLGAPGVEPWYALAYCVVFTGHKDADVETDAWVMPLGTKADLVAWLQANGESVPAAWCDAPGQGYLVKAMKDTRTPDVAVIEAIINQYK